MKRFQFCVNKDCNIACEAVSEEKAWQWLSETKKLTIKQCKTLYKLKQ